ncbi:MAG TPA: hypothetical protein VFG69_11230 [Nannocystaceae bacterium]|nr:hypothetical protein [Nannocystaceae bacterium]
MISLPRIFGCALALVACDGPAVTSAEPSRPAEPHADAPPPEVPAAVPGAAPAKSVQPPAVTSVTPVGWWRSDSVCLELFANGDFELSMPQATPKVMVMGKAKVAETKPGELAVELAVQRIWKARYTGPCRRTHELGKWVQSHSALGMTFVPEQSVALTLKRLADDRIELCGTECATLHREASVLGGKWTRAGFTGPDSTDLVRGDLLKLDLDVDGYSSSLWAASDASSWVSPLGTTAVESLGEDRFRISFTTREDQPGGELLGAKLAPGQAVELSAHRLAGERIEVCSPAKRCATLERDFDAYDHDLR